MVRERRAVIRACQWVGPLEHRYISPTLYSGCQKQWSYVQTRANPRFKMPFEAIFELRNGLSGSREPRDNKTASVWDTGEQILWFQVGFWTSRAKFAETVVQGNTTGCTPVMAARASSRGASAEIEPTSVNLALRWDLYYCYLLDILNYLTGPRSTDSTLLLYSITTVEYWYATHIFKAVTLFLTHFYAQISIFRTDYIYPFLRALSQRWASFCLSSSIKSWAERCCCCCCDGAGVIQANVI